MPGGITSWTGNRKEKEENNRKEEEKRSPEKEENTWNARVTRPARGVQVPPLNMMAQNLKEKVLGGSLSECRKKSE